MKPQGVLWAVVAFEASAAILYATAGLVDAVTVMTTALFLTFCIIVLLNWRARFEIHDSGAEHG